MLPIRAVVDHHVDRPDVEARQRVKLTGTNSSIGFIALIIPVHPNGMQDTEKRSRSDCKTVAKDQVLRPDSSKAVGDVLSFAGLVVMAGRNAPDPIPNSAVKLPSANGTPSQDAGE